MLNISLGDSLGSRTATFLYLSELFRGYFAFDVRNLDLDMLRNCLERSRLLFSEAYVQVC
jgi:hypothetical protein